MQAGSGAKNPPWARTNVNTNITGMNPQIMDPNAMMQQQNMMQYSQQQSVFNPSIMQQGGMAMQMTGQMPVNQMAQGQMYPGNMVAYPTPRAMNSSIYQNNQTTQGPATNEQRVFTGTVTKVHNDFGFVDHDVFYQTSVCAKGMMPKVNDRVLVEATYNPNMPFKWNATRVQILSKTGPNQKQNNAKSNYNAVPPPAQNKKSNLPPRRDDRRDLPSRREDRKRSRSRTRSRSRDRNSRRRDSPMRKRPVIHQPSPIKYVVRMPRIPLDIKQLDVPGLSQRYTNLYIPSDFFNAYIKWGETFPPQTPLSLNNPCGYHVMPKEVDNPDVNEALLEPPDADYRYSAKVMLISMPSLEMLYQKCGLTKPEDKDKSRSSKTPQHPTRLIKFLVGQKGKGGENLAIGGPWSPSLDGENPDTDPAVLVKTAIRTCKALTGIDLSTCTQWYRMVEFYYWRESSGKSRLETVVLFLPDVWAGQPSPVEWANVVDKYKAAADQRLAALEAPPTLQPADKPIEDSKDTAAPAEANESVITIDENEEEAENKPEPTHYSDLDLKTIKVDELRQELRARSVSCKGLRPQLLSRLSKLLKAEEENDKGKEIATADESQVEKMDESNDQSEDTKYDEQKDETKGDMQEDRIDEQKDKQKTEKEIEEAKKKIEKEKQSLKSRYTLPSTPHIIVHPSRTAKNGKFSCNVATLSLLLDYRITDNKEHSFELFVFAELFNEMLMRDFGFYIYKTLYTLPEKVDEQKESKEKIDDKKNEKKADTEKKDEEMKKDDEKKKEDEKKKDDEMKKDEEKKKEEERKRDDDKKKDEDKKRDDKRDDRSRRRDRKDSHSDDDRSDSPRRRGRGVDLPPDPYLLLSLVYFDTCRGGWINKKDLQNLFMGLGLQLSRSQIRSILDKVCIKDMFTYKQLVQAIKDLSSGTSDVMQDLPLETVVVTAEVPPQIAELEATIAAGNRNLLPLFDKKKPDSSVESSRESVDVNESGLVMYKSRLVDVGALVAADARGAAQRAKLEAALNTTRQALKMARQAAQNTMQAEKGAQSQLSDMSSRLQAANNRVSSLLASSKIFHSALKTIQSKVEAVVNIKYEDDDVVEVINGPKTEKDEKKVKVEKSVKSEDSKDKEESVGDTKDIKTDSNESKDSETTKDTDNNDAQNMDIDDKE